MNGVSKKLTVAGVGIVALLTLSKSEANTLAFYVAVSITVITLASISVQAILDYKNGRKENSNNAEGHPL
jgi:putative effector of murein hydrolase LrgA (UPF0299 family)